MLIGAHDYLSRQANFAAFMANIEEYLENGQTELMAPVDLLSMEETGEGDAVRVYFTDPVASMTRWENGGTVDRQHTGAKMRDMLVQVYDWSHSLELPINALNDDKVGLLRKRAAGNAAVVPRHFMELLGQALLDGFTYQGREWDGKAVFADDHPIDGTIQVNDNLSALNLDATNFAAAMLAFASMRHPAGPIGHNGDLLPMGSKPTALVYGEYNRANAETILSTRDILGTTNIDYGRVQPIKLDILSGDYEKYWFLLDLANPAAKPIVRVVVQGPRITTEEPYGRKVVRYGIDTRDNAALTHYGLAWGSTGT